MLRLLITGGSSYLGQHLVPLAAKRHATAYTYFSHDPLRMGNGHQLDLRDASAVQGLVTRLQPQLVIHTAGSNRIPDMENVIVSGTRHVSEAAQSVGARLIHISTDVVFDGLEAPYDEEAPPSPLHAYGRAKAGAEAIAAGHPQHTIVRTSLIYGLQQMDHATAWLVKSLREGQPVTLFTDQRRNPVWVLTLSEACLELAEKEYCGILHIAGEQELTRAEFGIRMLDWWGIEARSTLSFGTSDPLRWPQDCTLVLGRARAHLDTALLGVDAVLQQHARPS